MLYRKIEKEIEDFLKGATKKILLVDGARQVGKTFIIRQIGKKLYDNYVQVNLFEDFQGNRNFESLKSIEDLYLQLSLIPNTKLDKKENTLVFLDEIQTYPYLLTLLKFLAQDNKYTFICSGSLLGVALSETTSIPMGGIHKIQMYPLDFEEFLIANGLSNDAIKLLKEKYEANKSLTESLHNTFMDYFYRYLIVGGLPEVVNAYLEKKNITLVREIQTQIHNYYGIDASKYDQQHKLKIRRIYDMIPSNMENKKKRIIANKIEENKNKRYADYEDEFEYLISSGIALDVHAISNPSFPLIASAEKNLLKLYLNDVGLLTNILYHSNIRAIMNDIPSINLGSVYETVVASELKAHGFNLFYYDNKEKGEVDYLIDDYDDLSILPIEVKSGKDYKIHKALNNLIQDKNQPIKKGIVLSNSREVREENNILYLPIYYVMFIKMNKVEDEYF